MKNSTEQYASPPMDERSQSVLPQVLGNIAERKSRSLTFKTEKRGDFQQKTRLFIASMYRSMPHQCALFFETL